MPQSNYIIVAKNVALCETLSFGNWTYIADHCGRKN